MLGNFSKMFGGVFGGLISGAVTNLAIPAFQAGSLIDGCQHALASASGNWVGTLATMAVNGALGGFVTYMMPKNKKSV